MKKFLLFAFFSLHAFMLFAQRPAEIFSYHKDSLAPQHIYVQFDKQAYVAGDTAWFKAYLVSDFVPGTSGNFFIDLLDEKGSVITSKHLPVFEGSVIGRLEIPVSLRQAVYVIRAYTKWSLNFGQAYIFKKAIPVFNPRNAAKVTGEKAQYNFELFPENGKLVSGLANNIAFRATDQQLQPAMIKARLEDANGKSIGEFANGSQTAGVFSFTPAFKEKYFAVVEFPDKTTKKIEFPTALEKGAILTVADHELGKSFSALLSPGLQAQTGILHLVAVMNNQIALETNLELINNEAVGVISTKNLRPGILNLFLFDKDNNLLAKRTSFIQTENATQPVVLRIDTAGRTSKAKNVLSLVFPEPVNGNFSVSVTDADRELLGNNTEDIFSSILYQAGALKYIPNLKGKNEEALDVVSLSNEWYTADWNKLQKKDHPVFRDDLYLSLKGKIYEGETNKQPAAGNLNVIVQTKDLTQQNYTMAVENGNFKLDNLIFEDSARIYFEMESAKKNKKSPAMQLVLDEAQDNYASILNEINYRDYIKQKQAVLDNAVAVRLAAEQQDMLIARSANVTKTPAKSLTDADKSYAAKKDVNKRYSSGIFSTSNARIFDLINDPPAHQGSNIFDYLQGKVGGLIIEKAGGTRYNLFSSRSISTGEVVRGNRRGMVPGKVYLNGMEVTTDAIATIHVSQFALVKYFEPGAIMMPGVGTSPILAFWTKKQEDLDKSTNPDMHFISYYGYSPARPFYSPDYSSMEKNQQDNRVTIYWNPNLHVNSEKEIRIRFYNSDLAKRFHVVLEGITADGKLVHLDQVIE